MPGLSGQELTTEIRKFVKALQFFSNQARPTNRTSKQPGTLALRAISQSQRGILELVEEVGRVIAEARIAFPVAVDLPRHIR